MSLKKTTIVALLAASGLVASSASMAQSTRETGWYVGGSVAQTEADGTCPPGATCDFKDTGFKIFGGYRILRYLAVEGFYGNWGEITVRNAVATGTAESQTFGVAAVGILPLGQQFELFGKVGIGATEITATGGGATAGFSATESGSDVLVGIGAAFNFTRNFGLRAELERFNDSEINVMSIGLHYRF